MAREGTRGTWLHKQEILGNFLRLDPYEIRTIYNDQINYVEFSLRLLADIRFNDGDVQLQVDRNLDLSHGSYFDETYSNQNTHGV